MPSKSNRSAKASKKSVIKSASGKDIPVVQMSGVRLLEGLLDILIVAPHGPVINGKPRNDWNTGLIAELVAKKLNCAALINDEFLKPENGEKPSFKKKRLDLNSLNQMTLHEEYNNFFLTHGHSGYRIFVVHIHGCDNENSDVEAKASVKAGKYRIKPSEVQAFVGYGQGAYTSQYEKSKQSNDGKSKYTIPKPMAKKFAKQLTQNGLTTILVRDDAPNYRGRSTDNMNQYLRNITSRNEDKASVQIEIRESRSDTKENIEKTAEAIAKALSELVRPVSEMILSTVPDGMETGGVYLKELENPEKSPDAELVSEALGTLREIFSDHIHAAIVMAGQYIIKKFYGDNPHRVIKNEPVKDKSLNQLVIELKQNEGKSPSKSWFYNAVNLAAHEMICSKNGFQTFGKLGHSHKLQLLHVPKIKIIEADSFEEKERVAFKEKERLAKHAVENGLSVRKFKEYIDDQYPPNSIDLLALPPIVELRKMESKALAKLRDRAKKKIKESQKQIDDYNNSIKKLEKVLAVKNKNETTEISSIVSNGFR